MTRTLETMMQDETAKTKPRVWRVATGENAEFWPQCKDRGYVAVGWSDIPDFNAFSSSEELNDFLIERGGRGQRGARFIWQFVWEMRVGDIVVANAGERRLLGIGKVLSEYLPSNDPSNRMADTGFPHARRVEWLTTSSLEFEPHFFGWRPVTIQKLPDGNWQQIRERFVEASPERATAKRDLRALEVATHIQAGVEGPPLDPEYSAIEGALRLALRRHFARDARLRQVKIQQVLAAKGRLQCEVPGCGFDFAAVYGGLGDKFAHVHHDEQLSKRDRETRTELKKLRIVCANCHAMIHRFNGCRPLKGLIRSVDS